MGWWPWFFFIFVVNKHREREMQILLPASLLKCLRIVAYDLQVEMSTRAKIILPCLPIRLGGGGDASPKLQIRAIRYTVSASDFLLLSRRYLQRNGSTICPGTARKRLRQIRLPSGWGRGEEGSSQAPWFTRGTNVTW